LGLGRYNAESRQALGIDLRVLLARLVEGRGLPIVGRLIGLGGAKLARQAGGEHENWQKFFHGVVYWIGFRFCFLGHPEFFTAA
jgi:hypothetical protein